MIRKIIPVFTAAAISMSITFVAPVAITAASSFTFVSEAQAWGLKKIKRVAKRKYKQTKDIVTCKTCPNGRWTDPTAFGEFAGKVRRAPGKYTKRAGKRIKRGGKIFIRDTKGAGQIALGTAKAAGRTIDRRTSQACVALGSCQGTITRGASRGTKITGRRR